MERVSYSWASRGGFFALVIVDSCVLPKQVDLSRNLLIYMPNTLIKLDLSQAEVGTQFTSNRDKSKSLSEVGGLTNHMKNLLYPCTHPSLEFSVTQTEN